MSSTSKPKRIFHISDIHIFRNKRHQEHREVIDSLIKVIKDNKVDIVYIGGDVVDSKSRLSPEQISTAAYFFLNIANTVPIVMIPGNHDIDLKKNGALDSLTPIINNLETKHPIYYLTETGVYNLYDINWAVWSCIDNKEPVITGDDYVVGCYHGPVKGCITENGFPLPNAKELEDFEKCDIVMLGDIHKTQFFRHDEVVMPGSLLQVNIDENVDRGGILWEWSEKEFTYKPTFKKVENQYGFKTFNIEDLASFDEKQIGLPTDKFVCRLLYTGTQEDYSSVSFQEIRKKVKTLFPKSDIVLQKRFKKNKATEKLTQQTATSASKDWFKEFYAAKETPAPTVKALKELDARYDKSVDSSDYAIGEYFIEELQIENFLAFGEDNIIDFKSIEGIDGLFAPNTHGKSSILFAIMFCLFNKASKTNGSLAKLINDQMPEGTPAFVQLKLKINGVYWRIKRTITPSKKNISINVEVYETVDGDEVARHEESRPKTDAGILRKLLGDEETFLTLVLFNGNSANEFANNKNSNRLDLILKFLGISIYDKKLTLVDEELKESNSSHKSYVALLDSVPMKSVSLEKIEELKAAVVANEDEILKIKKTLIVDEQQLADLKRTQKALDVIHLGVTLEGTEREKAQIVASIAKLEKSLETLRATQSDLETEIDNRVETIEWLEESIMSEEEVEKSRESLYEARSVVKNCNQQLSKKYCIACGKPSEINEEELKTSIANAETEGKALEELLSVYSETKERIKAYHDLITQRYSKGQSIEIAEKDLVNQKQKLELLEQQLIVLKNNEDKIKEQALLENKIADSEKNVKLLERLITEKQTDIKFKENQITKHKDDILLYDSRETTVRESEAKVGLLTLYKQGMHRTGIPALILQQQIPLINQTLQNYTEDLFDFKIEFNYNSETLDIEFYYPGQKGVKRDVTQASGMEGTVINLVIRAALSEVTLLPKPSLLMLDEIFNTLDELNLEKLKDCLKRLKDNYQNIVVISHLEDVKDFPDFYISLERENNITTIKTS